MMTTMNLKLPDPRRFLKWMLLICALSVLLLAAGEMTVTTASRAPGRVDSERATAWRRL